jgi:hypothetical protein
MSQIVEISIKDQVSFLRKTLITISVSQGSHYADPCLPNPCSNSGLCFQLGSGGFMCQCTGTLWYGERCQHSKYGSCLSVQGHCGMERGANLVSMVHVPVYRDTVVWRNVPT